MVSSAPERSPLAELLDLVGRETKCPSRIVERAALRMGALVVEFGGDPGLLFVDSLWRQLVLEQPARFPAWADKSATGFALAFGFFRDDPTAITTLTLTPAEQQAVAEVSHELSELSGLVLDTAAFEAFVVHENSLLGRLLALYAPSTAYAPSQVPELRRTVLLAERPLADARQESDPFVVADDVVHELVHGAFAVLAFGEQPIRSTIGLAPAFEEATVRLLVAAARTVAEGVELDKEVIEGLGRIYSAEGAALVVCQQKQAGDLRPLLELAASLYRQRSSEKAAELLNAASGRELSPSGWLAILPQVI